MKISTSEAPHQCQAKAGSTEKVEIGYAKNIGEVCKRKLEMSKHKMERSQQRIQRQQEIIAGVRSKRIMWQSSTDCRRKAIRMSGQLTC